jgi:hypothetical protein
MSNEVTQSISMWIGNQQITNYFLGKTPAVYTANLAKGPLSAQYIVVGSGGDGTAGNGASGGAGGNGGAWNTGSLLIAPSTSATITAGAHNAAATITYGTTITSAGGNAGGSGGAGGLYPGGNGGNGTGGIVWYDGIGYAGGGGGGAPQQFAGGGAGTGVNGGGNGGFDPNIYVGVRGGGGGGGYHSSAGAQGGASIVVIRYFSGTQLATGGTVTFSNGYWYHTFNSNTSFSYT